MTGAEFTAYVRGRLEAAGLSSLGKVNGATLAGWFDDFVATHKAKQDEFPLSDGSAVPMGKRESRAEDQLFEAVAGSCGIKWQELTKTGRGPLNNAVKELRSVGATPEEVRRRALAFTRDHPQIRLTPAALCKHWGAYPQVTPTTPFAAAQGTQGWISEPPGDWRSWVLSAYPDDSWSQSAAALGWKSIPQTWRQKIAREFNASGQHNKKTIEL